MYIQLTKRTSAKVKQFGELGLRPLDTEEATFVKDMERILSIDVLNSLRQVRLAGPSNP